MHNLGVVIVTYNAADVIGDCLRSLIGSDPNILSRIVVVDNASSDATVRVIRDCNIAQITLIEAPENGGFAAGVNLGLRSLADDPCITDFWVLNPDCTIAPGTPRAFVDAIQAQPEYALMGGRVIYADHADIIQIDGGTVSQKTGVTGNINLRKRAADTPAPDPGKMDFITGASMVISRRFYEMAGPLREDYFLYYEEVDWAMRRRHLPLAYCPGGIVYHKAGSAIGSPSIGRGASAFSLYFKHRGRMRFMRRFYRRNLIWAYGYSILKAGQMALRGQPRAAIAILHGAFDLAPPAQVCRRLSGQTAPHALSGGYLIRSC